ncbi:RICIN domain-containing protein [Micromonospora taraxaci]
MPTTTSARTRERDVLNIRFLRLRWVHVRPPQFDTDRIRRPINMSSELNDHSPGGGVVEARALVTPTRLARWSPCAASQRRVPRPTIRATSRMLLPPTCGRHQHPRCCADLCDEHSALVGIAVGGAVAPSAGYVADNGPWEIFPASAVDLCVEVQGGVSTLSAQVQVYDCATWNGGVTPLHQRWIFRPTSGGYQRIVNGKTGMCANIKGSTDVNSTKIVQYNCGGSGMLNDQWYPQFVRKIAGSTSTSSRAG